MYLNKLALDTLELNFQIHQIRLRILHFTRLNNHASCFHKIFYRFIIHFLFRICIYPRHNPSFSSVSPKRISLEPITMFSRRVYVSALERAPSNVYFSMVCWRILKDRAPLLLLPVSEFFHARCICMKTLCR